MAISSVSFAKRVQIIHTNDVHSYFLGYGPEKGGYYRVKTLIDQLKKNAADQGISSIVLDAGDFGEGSFHFLHDNGLPSFKALDMLGVDAAVIGNHDYMFGGKKLSDQITKAGVETVFLGANFAPTTDMKLEGLLHPTVRFDVDGVNIEVIGLSTPEVHFGYAFSPGYIFPPNPVSAAHSKIARDENVDLIVALTHLGVEGDKALVEYDPEIDVVIGGHSHTRLESSLNIKNSEGRTIPIVQTGAHGLAVGSLVLDVNGPKDYKVVSYKLYDTDSSVKLDQDMYVYSKTVNTKAKADLAKGRWNDIIGQSEISLSGYSEGNHGNGDGCWIKHLGEIVKEGADADIGLYLSSFTGRQIDTPNITVGDVIENFPHIGEYGQPGWEIATFDIKGYKILALLLAMINLDIPGDHVPAIGGITYTTFKVPEEIPYIGGYTFFTSLDINDQGFEWKKPYKLALPLEFKRILDGVLPEFVRGYFPTEFETNQNYLWEMAETYISANSPLNCNSKKMKSNIPFESI
jgi:2',3'-cyclic-nucleotide 2'-phosphodiesterase (5'-nucleotidase family)